MAANQNLIKCVVVGDGMVGKTCMLITYVQKDFPSTYVPTIFENHAVDISRGEKTFNLTLYDTAGQEDFDRLRLMLYPETNCFIICFSIVYPTSLANVEAQWVPEIRSKCIDVPLILVGTKKDARNDPKLSETPVTFEEGEKMAKKIGAKAYMECSAIQKEGLDEIFEKVVDVGKPGNGDSKKSKGQAKKKGLFGKLKK